MKLNRMEVSHLFGLIREKFDFDENRLIAITGENGSGKSSIMDCVMFALFGHASASRGVKIEDYVRRGAEAGFVSLEYTDQSGTRRRVRRKITLRSKGAPAHTAEFATWDDAGGTWKGESDLLTDVLYRTAASLLYGEIEDMDKEARAAVVKQAETAFSISAFVSQGNIGKILSVAPAERMSLISSAFGITGSGRLKTDAAALKRLAESELGEAKAVRDSLRERLLRFGEGRAALAEALKNAHEEAAGCARLRDVYNEIYRTLSSLLQAKTDLASAISAAAAKEKDYAAARRYDRARKSLEARAAFSAKAAALKNAVASKMAHQKKAEALSAGLPETKAALAAAEAGWARLQEEYKKKSAAAAAAPAFRTFSAALAESRRTGEELRVRSEEAALLAGKYSSAAEEAAAMKRRAAAGEYFTAAEAASELDGKIREIEGKIAGELVGLLFMLSGGEETLRLKELKDDPSKAAEWAAAFESSQLKNLVQESGALKAEGARLKKNMEKLAADHPFINQPDGGLKEKDEILKRGVEELKKEARRGEEKAAKAESEKHRAEISKDYAEAQHRKAEETLAVAEKEKEAAGEAGEEALEAEKTLPGLRSELDGASEAARAARERLIKLENEIVNARAAAEAAEKEAARAAGEASAAAAGMYEAYKGYAAEKGFSGIRDAMRDAALAVPPAGGASLEERREGYLAARGLAEARKRDFEAKLEKARKLMDAETGSGKGVDLPRDRPQEACDTAEARAKKFENGYVEAAKRAASLGERINQMEKAEAELAAAEKKVRETEPLYRYCRQLAMMTDGNNFTRYVSDTAMELLLAGVNKYLGKIGEDWRLISRDGELFTAGEGAPRPVSGMSGGEQVLISVLLLREISNFGCLWLDESLPNLDDQRLKETVDVLTAGADSQLLLTTHDPDLARLFPLTWKMSDGRLERRDGPEPGCRAATEPEACGPEF